MELSKLAPLKRPPKKGPYRKYYGAKGHHTNDCVTFYDRIEVEERKGNMDFLLAAKKAKAKLQLRCKAIKLGKRKRCRSK